VLAVLAGDELSTVDVDDADGLPDFSLLVLRGRVAEEETDEEGVVGESTEMVCHFSASSLKFFELGDFVLLLSFFLLMQADSLFFIILCCLLMFLSSSAVVETVGPPVTRGLALASVFTMI